MLTYKTISDVRAANRAVGGCFFSPATMKFWQSRVETGLLHGKYFVTSETDGFGGRCYSVREALEDGRIKTVQPSRLGSLTEAEALIALLP